MHTRIETPWKRAIERLRRTIATRSRAQLLVDAVKFGAIGTLALASLAGVASTWLPSLETAGNLQAHIAVVCGVALLLALLKRSGRWAMVAVAALVVNVAAVGIRVAPVATCPVQMAATGHQTLRVMTYNIWGGNRDFQAVERLMVQQRPDVVVLQEVRPLHAPLIEKLRAKFPYQAGCTAKYGCGIVVLSRYPLGQSATIDLDHVMALQTAVLLEDQELVLVGAHMVRPFTGRLQATQFRALTKVVAALPSNALVAGDFNSALWSANMARYATASGVCVSNPTQATWPQWLGSFGIPIDHIFLKPGVNLLSIATAGESGSDHKALLATVGFPRHGSGASSATP